MEAAEEFDWYGLLGLGIDSTKEDIGKATRKLSLKYHPDKNSDPKAAEMFLLLQSAKNFLMDDEKRKEYDSKIRKIVKRKEYDAQRSKSMDGKRKKMKEDLEARIGKNEGYVPTAPNTVASEQIRRKSNVDDIDRLRKENKIRMEATTLETQRRAMEKQNEFMTHRKAMAEEMSKSNECHIQVKVKWLRALESHSEESLHKLFSIYGSIEDIAFRADKGNVAIVTFTSRSSAQAAVDAHATSEDLQVTFLKRKAAVFSHQYSSDSNPLSSDDLPGLVRRAVEKEELLRNFLGSKSNQQKEDNSVEFKKPPLKESIFENTASNVPSLVIKENDILSRMKAAAAAAKAKKVAEDVCINTCTA